MNLLSLFFYSKELTYVRRTRLLGITVETNRVFGYVTLIRFFGIPIFRAKLVSYEKKFYLFGIKFWSTSCSRDEMDKHNLLLQIYLIKNNKLTSKYIVSLCGAPSGEMLPFWNSSKKYSAMARNLSY